MSIALSVAVYVIIWWLSLFIVLPFGARSQAESGEVTPGTDPAAPVAPRLMKTVIRTTILASVLFALVYVSIAAGWVTMESLPGYDPRRL